MHEGGRFVWQDNSWHWKQGSWRLDRRYKTQTFTEGGGFSRTWIQAGGQSPWISWSKDWVVEKERVKIKKGRFSEKTIHQARYPFLAFKSEDHRQRFYLHRYEILFRLITGRAEAGLESGQAMLDLDSYFEKDKQFISGLIRQVKWLDLQVNFTISKQTLRAMDAKSEVLKFSWSGVAKAMHEVFGTAKVKEIEANITHEQKKRLLQIANRRRNEEAKILSFFQKLAYSVSQFNIPAGKININPVNALITSGIYLGTNFLTNTLGLPFASNLLGRAIQSIFELTPKYLSPINTISGPFNIAGIAVGVLISYALAQLWVDSKMATGVIKKINEARTADFGPDFAELAKQHPEDQFFPTQ